MLRLAVFVAALAVSGAAHAQGNSGDYLAGRSAIIANDYAEAADYYARALARDPGNVTLMENALTAFIGLGEIERAASVADKMVESGGQSQIAGLVAYAYSAKEGDWDGVLAMIDEGRSVGPLFDGLIRSWALAGKGEMSNALAAFDEVAGNQGVEAFGMYHKALALAMVGDYEAAAEIFSGESGTTITLTRRGIVAYAQVLSQLERNADAVELIDQTFGGRLDPSLAALRAALEKGETLTFTTARSAEEGVAEVFFSIANALSGEAQAAYTLVYGRLALSLRPDHIDALLLTAGLLEDLERYDLATDVYDLVPRDSDRFHDAELGRAEALRKAGRTDAAIEVLKQLSKSHGDQPLVHIALGDTLRGLERYDEAIAPYTAAIERIGEPQENNWIVFFARGIAYERTDQWQEAEADFRRALELRPEQPQVLNYLGYSFLEMGTNFDEALELIERAVELRPESGYIIDSLGWGLYRLGRFDEAVGHMERAVELMPVDPVVNDHLGDVYWSVGREREAEFQWQRALSFDPEPDEAERIRRKLEVGLDVVLEEEAAGERDVATDDG